MNYCHWIVYTDLKLDYRIVNRFETRGEAEQYKQSLNRLSKTCPYKVCFDDYLGLLN